MPAIVGLKALKERCRVTLHSDSMNVVDAFSQGWSERWRANGWMRNWMRNRNEEAQNPELWAILLRLCDHHHVPAEYVKAHAGSPENERRDELAKRAARHADLPPDEGYEAQKGQPAS